jgi:hypothetical protein
MSSTSPLTPPSAIISKVALHQRAAVIAKLQFVYVVGGTWHHVDGTTDIPLGGTVVVDPGEFGVPEGAQFQPYVFVVWGTYPQVQPVFTYQREAPLTATFTLTGTALENSVALDSIA